MSVADQANMNIPAPVAALAAGDLQGFAARFTRAGYQVQQVAPGMLQIRTGQPDANAVLLSVGVHGDETGPIELLAHLLDSLADQALGSSAALQVDLLLVVGNVAAIAAGKRFIDADLNRMFQQDPQKLVAAGLDQTQEAARGQQMMAASAAFFENVQGERWHLDLHTAIRPSFYSTFAIVPDLIADDARIKLYQLLGNGGIGAIIRNSKPSGTYSYFTAQSCAAAGATVELGRVGILGQNDLSQFAAMSSAMRALLQGQGVLVQAENAPHIFKLAQEITKLSEAFKMSFDRSTQNFTSLPQGALIATDGSTEYTVQFPEEMVVFPNPDVRVGQRAGLMVVRES